jgi:hypothetical protein
MDLKVGTANYAPTLLSNSTQPNVNSDFKQGDETKNKNSPQNERIKRQYFAYLKEAASTASPPWMRERRR